MDAPRTLPDRIKKTRAAINNYTRICLFYGGYMAIFANVDKLLNWSLAPVQWCVQ